MSCLILGAGFGFSKLVVPQGRRAGVQAKKFKRYINRTRIDPPPNQDRLASAFELHRPHLRRQADAERIRGYQ